MKTYPNSTIKRFEYYKILGDKTFDMLTLEELQTEFIKDSNSISIIVKHLVGNMHSRWTNLLTEDGKRNGVIEIKNL